MENHKALHLGRLLPYSKILDLPEKPAKDEHPSMRKDSLLRIKQFFTEDFLYKYLASK
jgi:hypothetical protein